MKQYFNVPIRMRDGVCLSADICHPDGGGPFPEIVHRTPYNAGLSSFRDVEAGYAVVIKRKLACDQVRQRLGANRSTMVKKCSKALKICCISDYDLLFSLKRLGKRFVSAGGGGGGAQTNIIM